MLMQKREGDRERDMRSTKNMHGYAEERGRQGTRHALHEEHAWLCSGERETGKET
jgi:hypothetical protein